VVEPNPSAPGKAGISLVRPDADATGDGADGHIKSNRPTRHRPIPDMHFLLLISLISPLIDTGFITAASDC
jgi:hypothetical protein